MATLTVEQSIRAQIDEINAVRSAFSSAINGRGVSLGNPPGPYPLWNFADECNVPAYANVVVGASLLSVDTAINAATIGSGIFGPWFPLQNSYFNANYTTYPDPINPTNRITTLSNAIANYFRWRVGQDFNACMTEVLGTAGAVPIQNVFPSTRIKLGNLAVATGGPGTYTHNTTWPNGTIPATGNPVSGPGVIGVYNTGTIGSSSIVMTLTCKYETLAQGANVAPSTPTYSGSATISNGTTVSTAPAAIVGHSIGAVSACNSTTGVVSMSTTSQFVLGQKVLIVEGSLLTGSYAASEVADVLSISSGASVTLGESMGSTAGLRGTYSNAAHVYPMFTDVTAVTHTGGTSGEGVDVKFVPDRPQAITT